MKNARTAQPQEIRKSLIECTILAFLFSQAATADWLITLDGALIETDGPWVIESGSLTYTDPDGQEHTLDPDDVDLEASEETTALRDGKPYEPRTAETKPTVTEEAPRANPAAEESPGKEAAEPKVVVYMTSLCRQCRQARELLEELGVAFVEKDIQNDRRARRRYDKIAGFGGGLPVLDIGGRIVYRYDPRIIRQRVEELLEKGAEAEAADP